MMVVDVSDEADFSALSTELKELGKKLGVEINIRNEKMYAAMHEMSGGLE
jgi:ACT domain-containing protein